LSLDFNQISDISPLSGMTNLTSLSLDSNQISDISLFSGMTNLTDLSLDFNQISDISPLSGMINFTSLSLDSNQISDISLLSGMTNLINLSLGYNQISDISPLLGMTNLTSLYLSSIQISDISLLSGMTNLINLSLDSNQISDISPLLGMTNLEALFLNYNHISDISVLSGMTNLVWLHLDSNQLNTLAYSVYLSQIQENNSFIVDWESGVEWFYHDPDPCPIVDWKLQQAIEDALGFGHAPTVSEMATLTVLDANDLGIVSVEGLEYVPNLESLDLSDNQISDLTLFGLTDLSQLDVSRNPLVNVDLTGLTSLGSLGIDNGNISSLVLDGLTSLNSLSAYGNGIVSIGLYNDPNLADVDLSGNDIVDVSSLTGLTGLVNLDLGGNLLNQEAYDTHLDNITLNNSGLTTFAYDPIEVSFVDLNLQLAVESALGFADPTKFEMDNLVILDANDLGVTSLKGLEYALNLQELNVSNNQITGIGQISELTTMTLLDLRGNLLDVAAHSKHLPKIDDNNPLTLGFYYDVNSNLLTNDNYVDPDELMVFASQWLADDADLTNEWANGSDVNHDGIVNMKDLAQLATIWLGVSNNIVPTVDDNIFVGE